MRCTDASTHPRYHEAVSERESPNAKRRVLAIVEHLPDDSSYDEILHELAFARMIERGLADAREGRTFEHEEIRRRARSWSE